MICIMKISITVLSSLMCLYGAAAVASDCQGTDCTFDQYGRTTVYRASDIDVISAPNVISAPIPEYAQPIEYVYADQIPMRSVKLLSVKPVPEDRRPAVWDGTNGTYQPRNYDKTVDWRDGVPVWDDSIVNYKKKDFSDWYLEPSPEIYLRETAVMTDSQPSVIDLYNQNMADAAATRARIEEILNPQKPCDNLWVDTADNCKPVVAPQPEPCTACNAEKTTQMPAPQPEPCPVCNAAKKIQMPAPRPEYVAQDMTQIVNTFFGRPDGCPFESDTECEIWRRKPIIRETVSPRSPLIRADKMEEFLEVVRCNKEVSANDAIAAPLLDRYKMLMRSANACCTDGMVYSLKRAGASDGLVYKFMSDDANFYGFGARCLMMTDQELDDKYPNTATAAVAADVRNGCLCRGRQWFQAMLAPFVTAYNASPEFAQSKFNYTYTDGLQRQITVSINNDVQNVLKQLSVCP